MSKKETENGVLPKDLREADGILNQIVEGLNEQIHSISDEQFERLKISLRDYFESFSMGPEDFNTEAYQDHQMDEALVKITLEAMSQARKLK
jgi:hypothetical protein